jgi:hypothetical protein
VITVLVDHNMEGQAALLWSAIASAGWSALAGLRFVTLSDVGLPTESSDRVVWRFAQAERMLLLTNNRKGQGNDSLARVMREELTASSLPILTVGTLDRIAEHEYRDRCAERLVEVALDLDRYLGTGRIFIP